jgi:hypothetical protein
MLHDVTIDIHTPGRGASREVVTVDAVSGDDAVQLAKIEAERIAAGRGWKIIGVVPSGNVAPPDAVVEGDDATDDPLVPDELEPVKRGPGRPRRMDS